MKSVWQTAAVDWYNAVGANFYYYETSVNTLNTFYESSTSLFGRIHVNYSSYIVTYFEAMLNTGNINVTQSDTVARSVANHELGHALGLDDIYSGTAIMNVNRNRSTVYCPRTDDINGVSAIYG